VIRVLIVQKGKLRVGLLVVADLTLEKLRGRRFGDVQGGLVDNV
jgi:hypothetical protein